MLRVTVQRLILLLFGLTLGGLGLVIAAEVVYFYHYNNIYWRDHTPPPQLPHTLQERPYSPTAVFTYEAGNAHQDIRLNLPRQKIKFDSAYLVTKIARLDSVSEAEKVSVKANGRTIADEPLRSTGKEQVFFFPLKLDPPDEINLTVETTNLTTKSVGVHLSVTKAPPAHEGLSRPYRHEVFTRKSDKLRIVVIGGSTTYGMGLAADQTWPHLLQVHLDLQYPGTYEIINLGRLGGSLEEFILNYDTATPEYIPREDIIKAGGIRNVKGLRTASIGWKDLNPDLVIAVPIINDSAPDFMLASKSKPSLLSSALESRHILYWKKSLALFGYLDRIRMQHTTVRELQDISATLERLGPKISENLSDRLKVFAGKWNVPLIIANLPILFSKADTSRETQMAERYFGTGNQAGLDWDRRVLPFLADVENEVFRKHSPLFFDIADKFKTYNFKDRLNLFNDSIHLNARGAAIVAGIISPNIEDALLQLKIARTRGL